MVLEPLLEEQIEELSAVLEMAEIGTLVICACNLSVLKKEIITELQARLGPKVKIVNVVLSNEGENPVSLLLNYEKNHQFKKLQKKYQKLVYLKLLSEKVVSILEIISDLVI